MFAIRNILVATDFSACSSTALAYGRAFARQFGARLHVLHTIEQPLADGTGAIGSVGLIPELQAALEDAERARLEAVITAVDRDELHTTIALRKLDVPAHAIVEYAEAEQIDLLIIGTHGRHGLALAVMGSVAERVVRTAPCPVLTVRAAEHDFVVPEAHGQSAAGVS